MNFIRGELKDGAFHLNSSCSLSLWERAGVRAEAVHAKPLPNGPAHLGIRPEDLILGEHRAGSRLSGAAAPGTRPAPPTPTLGPVTLDVVEQMGHESIGYFQLAGQRYAMRLPADAGLTPGDAIEPRLRPNA